MILNDSFLLCLETLSDEVYYLYMANVEHQLNPQIHPTAEWIEIHRASANVDYAPTIESGVLDLFDLVVDPTDDRNQWLKPKKSVTVLGFTEDDEQVTHFLEVPSGLDTRLIYVYDAETGYGNYSCAVSIEELPQLTFPINS